MRRWTFSSNPSNLTYRGQGAHNLAMGDVDSDGKDEITHGAVAPQMYYRIHVP